MRKKEKKKKAPTLIIRVFNRIFFFFSSLNMTRKQKLGKLFEENKMSPYIYLFIFLIYNYLLISCNIAQQLEILYRRERDYDLNFNFKLSKLLSSSSALSSLFHPFPNSLNSFIVPTKISSSFNSVSILNKTLIFFFLLSFLTHSTFPSLPLPPFFNLERKKKKKKPLNRAIKVSENIENQKQKKKAKT